MRSGKLGRPIAPLPHGIFGACPANAATSASVTINATAGLGTIPAGAIGLDTAVYDGDMNDAAIPALLANLIVSAAVTLLLNAMGRPHLPDQTQPGDYLPLEA